MTYEAWRISYQSSEQAARAAYDEAAALRTTMVDLLEILRQWEPDHSSGKDRQRIVLAMYQIGVLHDPTATVAAMQTPNAELTGRAAAGREGPR